MTLTADQAGDTLSILGRKGVITDESSDPDKVLIDVDLPTLSALVLNVDNELLVNVDGSTVTINGSGQLATINLVNVLDDLSDVSVPTPSTNDVLAYVDGASASEKWQDLSATISGTTAAGSGTRSVVYDLSTGTGSAAVVTHDHEGSTSRISTDTHTHDWEDPQGNPETTDPPDDTANAIDSIGDNTSGQSAVTSISTTTVSSLASETHTHAAGTLAVSFS